MYKYPIAHFIDEILLKNGQIVKCGFFTKPICESLDDYPKFVELILSRKYDFEAKLIGSDNNKVIFLLNLYPIMPDYFLVEDLHKYKRHQLKIHNVFEKITYEEMRDNKKDLHCEYYERFYNPSRLQKFMHDD